MLVRSRTVICAGFGLSVFIYFGFRLDASDQFSYHSEKAILFELKQLAANDEKPLEEAAQKAHSQAVERYSAGIKAKWNPKKCLALGVGFWGKQVKAAHSFEV